MKENELKNGLNFEGGYLRLLIAGIEFNPKMDSDFARTVSRLSEKADMLSVIARLENGYDKVNDFFREAVDALLGCGSVERIFNGKEPDCFDLLDIISYIADSFYDYQGCRLDRLKNGRGLCI